MTKVELRRLYRTRQAGLSVEARGEMSGRIAARFFDAFVLSASGYVHCFIGSESLNEIDTSAIINGLQRNDAGVKVVVPKVNFATNQIRNLPLIADTELIANRWGILEPVIGEPVDPKLIDLALIPGLCFDRRGSRVGYGKGFYDRMLLECRPDCLKVGLSYFAPVNQISNLDAHDIGMDYCVTPDRVWNFTARADE